ncbi:type II secretion system minor pseudopilin GspJ [uncultured Psychrobacter sp.]|uniref:type II secretion system minor pseudopilin GspJ n=1 Tax=uncultured Psychrobacter sp. TaxID=259303 RepID=UPI003458F32C
MRQQRGFTLLELMVAMSIFAMLAVAGWQVFDSVNRARERAQYHADQLAVLQYAYLQLQQDMGQIIAYQVPSDSADSANSVDTNDNQDDLLAEPFMSLNEAQISFVRFADPDPRYQSSPSLQRVDYVIADERLIRRQYTDINSSSNDISLDTVLLEGITTGLWQAYLPEVSTQFPSSDLDVNDGMDEEPEVILLPKGVGISFTYEDTPITWQFALAPQPLPNSSNSDDPYL